jgi:hypothetical protein
MAKALHNQLVEASRRWLQRQCSVVMTEMATIGEEPDAIGWRQGSSILAERKASRSDFLADGQKFFRKNAWFGIGRRRYYGTPPGLLDPAELPAGWGLLEWNGKIMRTLRKADMATEVNAIQENNIFISALRRIGRRAPKGVSIKCYTYAAKDRATLGIQAEDASVEDFEI